MISLLTGHDAEIGEWVARNLPHIGTRSAFGPYTALGVVRDDMLIAGVIFHDYQPQFRSMAVGAYAASPAWATRPVLSAIAAYVFVQKNCERFEAVTPKKLRHVRATLERLGFKLEGVKRRAFGTDDACIYGMLRHECRWLKEQDHADAQSAIAA